MKNEKVKKLQIQFIDEFINCLKENKLIWEEGWKIERQKNLISNYDYKGYNQLILMYVASKKGYTENCWLTFNQANEKKLHIKKGSKSVPIRFVKYYDKKKKEDISYKDYLQAIKEGREKEVTRINRHYNIFNVSDIEGYQPTEIVKNDILALDKYLKHSQLEIEFVGNQPCYIPSMHKVQMPQKKQFKNDDEYYSTLLHELSHSTKKHVERELPEGLKTKEEKYAFEELVAEISSVLLCCEFGIELKSIQNNKAYIQSWIQIINEDKEKNLMMAIKNANNISNYIVNNLE